MTELLLQRAREIAPNIDPMETTLLIVAHGTDLNDNSAAAAKREADKIRSMRRYADVLNVYMEEPPLVSDWQTFTTTANVVVVPFFISDGLHSYEDIPVLLGMAEQESKTSQSAAGAKIFRHNPYRIGGRSVYYAPAIGTDERIADIIVAQTLHFGS